MTRKVRVRVSPPPGVTLIPNFITEEEEEQIIAELDASAPWERLSKRRVAHFVSRFDYASRGAEKGGAPAPPLPPCARAAVDRVLETASSKSGEEGSGFAEASTSEARREKKNDDGCKGEGEEENAESENFGPSSADQITVKDYPPGSGIAPHVDTHSAFTSRFASLSLGAGVAFELRRGGEAADLWLPRRSLLLLGGEARLGWAHYIAPRRGDSVSRERAGMDPEVARAVALAEEKERQAEEEEEEGEGKRAAAAAANGGGGGSGGKDASTASPSTTVVIPRRRRVSITIRQIRPASTPCVCAFPSECDSQGGGAPPTRAALKAAAAATAWDAAAGERAAAAASAVAEAAAAAGAAGAAVLERSLVSDVYDRIAPHFDSTRFAVWPQVAAFLKKCVEGGDGEEEEEEGRKKDASNPTTTAPKTKTNRPHLLLDVGCGNGKYLHLAPPGTAFLACEPCEGLAGAAADAARGSGKGFGAAPASKAQAQAVCVARADGIAMPYRSGVFDGVICIAVIHHFATAKRRRALLASIGSRLAPGGRALVTAWATPASQPEGKEKKAASRWVPLESSQAGIKRRSGDFLVPWHEPPGWPKEKERREREGKGGGEEDEREGVEEGETLSTPPSCSSSAPKHQQQQQKQKKGAPRIIQQAPPVAWRFYHCYEREELASDAAAGAAAASAALLAEAEAEAAQAGEEEESDSSKKGEQRRIPVVVALRPFLDKVIAHGSPLAFCALGFGGERRREAEKKSGKTAPASKTLPAAAAVFPSSTATMATTNNMLPWELTMAKAPSGTCEDARGLRTGGGLNDERVLCF